MRYLLDTNVISEWVKPQPNIGVIEWLANIDEDRVFISVVTVTELRYGIERLASGSRRTRLEEWLQHEIPLRFEERILPITHDIADACGKVIAVSASKGRPIEAVDAFILATAQIHHLTVVTRNVSDFHNLITPIINPWARN